MVILASAKEYFDKVDMFIDSLTDQEFENLLSESGIDREGKGLQLLEQVEKELEEIVCLKVEKPSESIQSILNLSKDTLNDISDLDIVQEFQFRLSQYLIYLNQKRNAYEGALRKAQKEYDKELGKKLATFVPKTKSLAEKKMIINSEDEKIAGLDDLIMDMEQKVGYFKGLDDKVKIFLEVLRQHFFRLKESKGGF